MLKHGKRIQNQRKYSEEFKLKLVKEYELGTHSVLEISKIYDIHHQSIYDWIYRYSEYNKKNIHVVEMKDSQAHKLKQLEGRIRELEQAVGQKQMKIDFLEKMIELADEHYEIDIKKNSSTPPSGGSKTTERG